jgi:hypothetical protein
MRAARSGRISGASQVFNYRDAEALVAIQIASGIDHRDFDLRHETLKDAFDEADTIDLDQALVDAAHATGSATG